MKRKTPPIRNYFKPVGSTSNSTTENNNPLKETEITEQLAVHNDSNTGSIDVQTSDKNTKS
jgi:hypothetical protein